MTGIPSAEMVRGWLSPGWHQPMRSATPVSRESCASAAVTNSRSPMSLLVA
jgi:hypothetical protein